MQLRREEKKKLQKDQLESSTLLENLKLNVALLK